LNQVTIQFESSTTTEHAGFKQKKEKNVMPLNRWHETTYLKRESPSAKLLNATSKILINYLVFSCLLNIFFLNYSCANSALFTGFIALLVSDNLALLVIKMLL